MSFKSKIKEACLIICVHPVILPLHPPAVVEIIPEGWVLYIIPVIELFSFCIIIVKTKRRMIWTLFRIINLHPMQISITSQAIRKSLKRASTRSESHRAIVHFYYVFHSAYSYLSFFLADRVSISYPYTFSEISKIFAAMAGVSRIGSKKWVDGRVDGAPLGKPASPCAPGVSAGRHRVDMGGFGAGCPSNATKSDGFSTLGVRVLKFIVRSHKCVSLDTIPG